MALHAQLTHEIRTGPSGPKVAAFFDLDQTLLAGFSATSFFRERIVSGRVSPREFAQSLLGTLSFALGRTGFSGLMSVVHSGPGVPLAESVFPGMTHLRQSELRRAKPSGFCEGVL